MGRFQEISDFCIFDARSTSELGLLVVRLVIPLTTAFHLGLTNLKPPFVTAHTYCTSRDIRVS